MKKSRNLVPSTLLILAFFLGACEGKEFRKAEAANTVPAFEAFLKKYPHSSNRDSALGNIYFLAYSDADRQNTIPAFEDFLRRYPESGLRTRAIQTLLALWEPEVKKMTPAQISKMRAVIKTELGEIKIRFEPEKAPDTCRNFIRLARSHFYDQTQFYQVIPSYLIQAGSPSGDARGGPGYTIKAEVNDLPNIPGAVGMDRGSHPDSAGSLFYICLARIPERDRKYTVLGSVESGMETAQAISRQDSFGADAEPDPYKPMAPIYIKTIEIVEGE